MRFQSFERLSPLAKRVLITHWCLVGLTIALETLFVAAPGDSGSRPQLIVCIALLAILAVTSIYWPEKHGRYVRLALVVMEVGLVAGASMTGSYRWIWPLYLVLVARGALLVDRRDVKVIVALCCLGQFGFYLVRSLFTLPPDTWSSMVAASLLLSFMMTTSTCVLTFVVAWLMITLMNEQLLREQTETLSRENSVLAAELERTRIAREIHDTLGHSLTSLKIQLELAGRLLDTNDDKARVAVSHAESLAARSLTDTRVALQSIRNSDFDFAGALNELTREIKSSGAVELQLEVQEAPLSNAVSYQLYRVIQECLTNTLKHAQASKVLIRLRTADRVVQLDVEDNGKGFDSAKNVDGLGLKGLRERIASVQGTVEVFSDTGKGTTVSVTVPLG